FIDAYGADIETMMPTTGAQVLRRASIAGRGVLPAVIREQATATVSTTGDALQQSTAFSHGSSRLVSFGTGVAPDTYWIGLERRPIQKPKVMIMEQDRPFLYGQAAASLPHDTLFIDIFLRAALSIHIGTGVNRIGEHLMDGPVGRHSPLDICSPSVLL